MELFVAVVEDRDDPLHIGRCRIRIFGKHTDDKSILPTSDLPWAMPIQSIDSAAVSGIGKSPVGPVLGTWVVGFFLDGDDMQQPVMMGTIGSAAAPVLATTNAGAPVPPSENRSTNTSPNTAAPEGSPLQTEDGSVVKDGSGSPIRTENVAQPSGWVLGQTSKKYESGGKGAGTINAYASSGDLGGASYGTYQFASYLPPTMPSGKARPSPKNSPILKYCGSSKFAAQFAGLNPATAEFDAKWKECATKYGKEFEDDQHQYIEDNYYKVMLGKLKQAGLDLSSFGAGVQDLIWSTAVQFGPGRITIFTEPLKGKTNLDDKTIIEIVSDYKIDNVDKFFKSSSQNIRDGVRNRYKSEKTDLLKLSSGYTNTAKPVTPAAKEVADNTKQAAIDAPKKSDTMPYSPVEDKTNTATVTATSKGYSDPDGTYPKKTYSAHPDTNKMATGRTDGTATEAKTKRRAIGMALPNGQAFDQPINTFNAKYPYNKVMETESGHVIEYDDTPGAERINIWHRSGTFMEMDSVGNMVRRSSGSTYEIVDKNGYLYVQGKCNISVGGSANVMVAADANIEISGDANISVGNDVTVEAAGEMKLSAGEALHLRSKKIFIDADEELQIKADNKTNLQTNLLNVRVNGDTNVHSDGVTNVKSIGDTNIQTDGKLSLKASGEVGMDGSKFDWGTGSSNAAGTAEDALNSQAGMKASRTSYEEKVIKESTPLRREDVLAIQVETPEESAIAAPKIQKILTEQGIVTQTEISKMPVFEGMPDISKVLTVPTISLPGIPNLGGIAGDAIGQIGNILTSGGSLTQTVMGALSRIQRLDLPVGDIAILQKLLHAGLDVVRLQNIPKSINIGLDLGGIGLSKAINIPGLNSKLLNKIRNLRLSPKEVTLLKAIDLLNVRNMDLSSPEGVIKTMRGMTAELMKFGVYNPEFAKITKVLRNLSYVPPQFKVTPNFAIRDLTFGAALTKDKLLAQCGLKESDIAANLFGVAHNCLEPIKKSIPEIQLLSGFRTDNGQGYVSPHFTGNAIDIRVPDASKADMYDIAQQVKKLVPFDQLGLESTSYNSGGDWLHLSFNSEGDNRGQVFTMHNHKKVGDGLIQLF